MFIPFPTRIGERSGKPTSIGLTMLMVVFVGVWLAYGRPWESATQRAYRECALCGIDAADVNQWIDDNAHSMLTREESAELYRATVDDHAEVELCRPCVEAVLGAAESGG